MSRSKKLIQLYLTNMCNSACKTCTIWKNKNRSDIPVNKIIEMFDDFPDADYVFGGGEFTLYAYKYELLSAAERRHINYTVLSNAVNLSLLEQLLTTHRVQNLTMSCDGVDHDLIRGRYGNLHNIETIIEHWRGIIPNIKLSYTLSKLNESNIDEDMAYFKSLGFDKIYFCIAQNLDVFSAEDDVSPDIKSIQHLYDHYKDMLYDKDQQFLSDMLQGHHRKCDSLNDIHTIYTNGDVVRCAVLSNDIIGNIYERSLRSILDDSDKCYTCALNDKCNLVCQRRYDYEKSRI